MATLSKITLNSLAANTVSANNIANSSITGVKLSDVTVTGDKIANTTITGEKYGLNSISSNTINVGDQFKFTNVSIAKSTNVLGGVIEKVNIIGTGLPSSFEVNAQNDGSIVYYTGISSSNATVNFVGLSSMLAGNVASYVVIITNDSSTRRRIETVQIDGQTQVSTGASANLNWVGGLVPTPSANTDMYNFTIIKTSNTPTYNVFASSSTFKPN